MRSVNWIISLLEVRTYRPTAIPRARANSAFHYFPRSLFQRRCSHIWSQELNHKKALSLFYRMVRRTPSINWLFCINSNRNSFGCRHRDMVAQLSLGHSTHHTWSLRAETVRQRELPDKFIWRIKSRFCSRNNILGQNFASFLLLVNCWISHINPGIYQTTL